MLFIIYRFRIFVGCGLCISYFTIPSLKTIPDPDVFPLLSATNPKNPNNLTNSFHVKSLGCFLNRSISFSFVLIFHRAYAIRPYIHYRARRASPLLITIHSLICRFFSFVRRCRCVGGILSRKAYRYRLYTCLPVAKRDRFCRFLCVR